MTEDSVKPPEPSTHRFVNRLGDKITDQAIGWVLSGGAVTFITLIGANWSKIKAATWETRVPLALLISLAPPAAFGFYALYRVMRARRRTPLYFTIDPQQTHISAHRDGRTNQRLITLQLIVTIANPTRDRNLIYRLPQGNRTNHVPHGTDRGQTVFGDVRSACAHNDDCAQGPKEWRI